MFLILTLFSSLLFYSSEFAHICPNSQLSAPQTFTQSKTFSLTPFTYNSETYTPIELAKTIWLKNKIQLKSYSTKNQTNLCPTNYRIPLLSDFENLLSNLTKSNKNVYNTITDVEFFNLPSGSYAITNSKADDIELSYNFYALYVNETAGTVSIKNVSLDKIPNTQYVYIKCIIETNSPEIEMNPDSNSIYVGDNKNFGVNENFLTGSMWRINNNNENIIKNNFNISYTLNDYGLNMIENWHYDLLGYLHYRCKNVFVDMNMSYTLNTFSFNNDYKKINTTVSVNYNNKIHFTYSNAPVAPRTHGGYYIAIKSKSDNNIHILSYDKNDNLVKNFNTEINGNVLDIVATNIGFAIYISSNNNEHSYINIYNINFELLYSTTIMNNKYSDRTTKEGNNIKQYTIENGEKKIVEGTEFMYNPINGKLIYSSGRIFLIFSYKNYNNKNQNGLNGDSIISLSETGSDIDFSAIWKTSQSFIQTITEEPDWVWTASLSDKIGLNVFHTSKNRFINSSNSDTIYYYNERINYNVSSFFGTITYTQDNFSYAKLGGLVYIPKYEILAMVYSQTKDASQGKNGIYISLFSFSSSELSYKGGVFPLKEFESNQDVFNVRAGKLGDLIIVLYVLSSDSETVDKNDGNLPKGKNTMMMVVEVTGKENISIVNNGLLVGTDAIGTNEDMRNFKDGRLIWTSVDQNGNVIVHRLGTLSNYDDNKNDDDDVVTVLPKNEENQSNDSNNSSGKKSSSHSSSKLKSSSSKSNENKSSSSHNTGSIDESNNSKNNNSKNNDSKNNNSKNSSDNDSKNKNSSSSSSKNLNYSSDIKSNSKNENNDNINTSSNSNNSDNINNLNSMSSESTSNTNNNNNNSKNNEQNFSSSANESNSNNINDDSSSDEKENKLFIYILIAIIIVLLITLALVLICYCMKKPPKENENEKKNNEKDIDNNNINNNNNTHVSQATSNVNLNSNLGTNTISIYRDMNNLNNNKN
jgi:hypothetical protein